MREVRINHVPHLWIKIGCIEIDMIDSFASDRGVQNMVWGGPKITTVQISKHPGRTNIRGPECTVAGIDGLESLEEE